ncbi:hypothetical protein [Dyadobacter sp. 3J3]|uniref:hypothetical protein n=1 Tax=Dyadobacter sp. 3J3 TaxID=2606600 RepID=UPI001E28CC66|nr:hypothetical protein [Dyadobacter sp. 3J3]
MIKKQQIYKALLAACMLFSSSAVFAQVKIGTNPTVIDPANNLEVESSTAGNKVSVDKTTGKVTIADGSQGVGKILTSDANGGASWQAVSTQDSPVLFSVVNSINQTGSFQTIDKADFGTKHFDKNNSFNLGTDSFTIPANGTGLYQLSTIYGTLNAGNYDKGVYLIVYVNGVSSGRYLSIGNSTAGAGIGGSGSILMQFNSGDVVDIRILPSLGAAGQTITFFHLSLSVSLISK